MASKQGRVKALLSRNIVDIVTREIKNPHIGMVCVNEVKITDDYGEARVYVSFLGVKYPHQALLELKKTEGFVRTSLAKKVDLYKVPKIVFYYDETAEEAAHLEQTLRKEGEELEKLKG